MPYYIKKKKTEGKPKKSRKRSLIDKLDKVFSLYIRMRDSKQYDFHAFRCISCGQIKSFDQADCGHYFSRTHMATRFSEDNCHAECSYCMTPRTHVLLGDMTWRALGHIKEGDELMAFSERYNAEVEHEMVLTKVTHVHRERQMVYEVELDNGDVLECTKEHRFLASVGGFTSWLMTSELSVGTMLYKPFRIGMDDFPTDWWLGMGMESLCVYNTTVKEVRARGEEEIVVMETDSHTFIAEGYAMHNCNRFKADHLEGYRRNLIEKIGEKRFEWLYATHNTTKNWSEFELEQMINFYKKLTEALKHTTSLKMKT